MGAVHLARMLANAERIAERAHRDADLYAEQGTPAGRRAGTGFYRRGGVDAAYLAELRRKADDADRAVEQWRTLIAEATR